MQTIVLCCSCVLSSIPILSQSIILVTNGVLPILWRITCLTARDLLCNVRRPTRRTLITSRRASAREFWSTREHSYPRIMHNYEMDMTQNNGQSTTVSSYPFLLSFISIEVGVGHSKKLNTGEFVDGIVHRLHATLNIQSLWQNNEATIIIGPPHHNIISV